MKPLFFTLKIFGLMPYHVTSKGQVAFEFISAPMLYSAVMVTGIVISSVVTLRDSFQRAYARNVSSFECDIAEMTFSTGYVFLIVMPCVRFLEYRKITRFINDWGNLQTDFTRITGKSLALGLRRKVHLTIAALLLWVAALGVSLRLTSLGLRWWQITATLLCSSVTWIMSWLFTFTCLGLNSAARIIADEISLEVANKGVGRTEKIAQYKFLWLRLSYLTQDLGNSMGFSYGALIVLCFAAQVLSCYGFLSSIGQGIKLTQVTLAAATTFIGLLLFCICSAANCATQQVGSKFQARLYTLIQQNPSASFQTSNEIQLFISTISSNPPAINLSGFVVLDRGVNTALISQMVTYLIVLMQFQLSSLDAKGDLNYTNS
ncbi:gustatory and odorant receptor 24-like [Zootermopsis nevadensis]|nr:gustatory and odorant receptor 24-like [Zootermopsis nevadensis]